MVLQLREFLTDFNKFLFVESANISTFRAKIYSKPAVWPETTPYFPSVLFRRMVYGLRYALQNPHSTQFAKPQVRILEGEKMRGCSYMNCAGCGCLNTHLLAYTIIHNKTLGKYGTISGQTAGLRQLFTLNVEKSAKKLDF